MSVNGRTGQPNRLCIFSHLARTKDIFFSLLKYHPFVSILIDSSYLAKMPNLPCFSHTSQFAPIQTTDRGIYLCVSTFSIYFVFVLFVCTENAEKKLLHCTMLHTCRFPLRIHRHMYIWQATMLKPLSAPLVLLKSKSIN